MSHIAKFTTQIKDGDLLAAALRSMGYTVEQHATPQRLSMFSADQVGNAEIIIRKNDPALNTYHWADIGFARQPDGTFQVVCDSMEMDKLNQYKPGAWMQSVTRAYTEQYDMAWAIGQGFVFAGAEDVVQPDGTIERVLAFDVRE
jgi:hypothetical protein